MTIKDRNIRKVLVKISQELNHLPSSLLIFGVHLYKREVVGQGEYADVFRGELAGAEVALKRPRVHKMSDETSERKVSALLQVMPFSNVTCYGRGYIERFLYGIHSTIRTSSRSLVWI
jgi:hypothetical protein